MRKRERNSLVQALPWEKPVTAPFVNCGKASLQNRNPKRKRTCAQGGKLHRFLSNWAMVPPCSLLLIRSAHLHWKCESHALPPWRTRVTKEAGGNKKTATSYSWRPCQKRKEKKKKKNCTTLVEKSPPIFCSEQQQQSPPTTTTLGSS